MIAIFDCFRACFGYGTQTTTMDTQFPDHATTPIKRTRLQHIKGSAPEAGLVGSYTHHQVKHDQHRRLNHGIQPEQVKTAGDIHPQTGMQQATGSLACLSSPLTSHSHSPQEDDKPEEMPLAWRTRSKRAPQVSEGAKSTPNAGSLVGRRAIRKKAAYPFQRRATQRWCKLLTATKSRLVGNGIKDALGPHWLDFVQYANTHFRPQWITTFSSPMHCKGPLEGGQCPWNLGVVPTSPDDLHLMQLLHLDHAYALHHICRTWINIIHAQSVPLASWDQGVDGDLVCQLLFGINDHPNFLSTGNTLWKANLQFRCYHKGGQGCHDVCGHANAHLKLNASDLLSIS